MGIVQKRACKCRLNDKAGCDGFLSTAKKTGGEAYTCPFEVGGGSPLDFIHNQ
jgi:hypothetical protein